MTKKIDLSKYAIVTERLTPGGDTVIFYRGIDDPSDEIAVSKKTGKFEKCRVKYEVRKWQ